VIVQQEACHWPGRSRAALALETEPFAGGHSGRRPFLGAPDAADCPHDANFARFRRQRRERRRSLDGTRRAVPVLMNAGLIAGLVVMALLVGAALPVLAQARVSLRALQRTVDEAGPRLNRALDEVSEVAVRCKRELAAFEDGGQRAALALKAVDDLGSAALELRRTVKVAAAIGAAVGPGIAAAVRTLREPSSKDPKKENHHEAA
jgi:hypothetical protein